MAGKKKVNDDVGMSKTARASSLKKGGKPEGFIASTDMERIVSLGGGTYLYVMDPRNGKTIHLQAGSTKYNEFFLALFTDEKHGERVRAELVSKGFSVPVDLVEMLDSEEELEASV